MKRDEDIVWQSPEYFHEKKHSDWYWALGIIALAGMLSAYMFSNVLLCCLIFLIGFTMALFGARAPKEVSFGINRKGIRAGNTIYPLYALYSFWVLEKEKENLLLLKSQKFFSSQISIPLGDADPDMVREFLLDHIPEEEDRESVAQKIMDYLGF